MTQSPPPARAPRIYLLDIDGTVMPSCDIDNQCYWQAIDDVLGGAPEPVDLSGFDNVTDSGVLSEWLARKDYGALDHGVCKRVKSRFLELTRQAAVDFPRLFQARPGLLEWIRCALEPGDTGIGFATGGWRHTSEFKLATAGLDLLSLPLASSDDATCRTEIMQIALKRTRDRFSLSEQDGQKSIITYIGDGIWDLESSRKLGWEFIGIADESRAKNLHLAGATRVMRDFRLPWNNLQ